MTLNVHRFINPVIRRIRVERMHRFAEDFAIREDTRILDVGGTTLNWSLLDVSPDVTLLNLDTGRFGDDQGRFTIVVGNGCRLPFGDDSFDVVFCNSLIEHLPVPQQRALANEIRRVGRSWFVETPNYWFPVEPHFWAPFFHWLPLGVRRRVVRWATPWGLLARPSREAAMAAVDEMRLLTAADLCAHFPDGLLRVERMAGLPKSLIVARRPEA